MSDQKKPAPEEVTNKILQRMAYVKKLTDKPYESSVKLSNGDEFFFDRATPEMACRWSGDLHEKNMMSVYIKYMFFRALDSRGNRLFTTQKHLQLIKTTFDEKLITEFGQAVLFFDTGVDQQMEALKEDAAKN